MESTGPNTSSRAIAMSRVTPVTTVGSTYMPIVPMREPPSTTCAPACRAASTCERMISSCLSVVIAPTCTPGTSGSPTLTRFERSTTAAANFSAIVSCTRMRLPLLQHWPALK